MAETCRKLKSFVKLGASCTRRNTTCKDSGGYEMRSQGNAWCDEERKERMGQRRWKVTISQFKATRGVCIGAGRHLHPVRCTIPPNDRHHASFKRSSAFQCHEGSMVHRDSPLPLLRPLPYVQQRRHSCGASRVYGLLTKKKQANGVRTK